MNATVVKLGNITSVQSSDFEEAFGEYSEARGRGRARRKKRKLERIANRAEVRKARQEARKERKVGRQEVKQATKEARIAKRRTAQQARQDKRGAAMEARQQRRTSRKQYRLDRRAMGDQPEMEMDEQTAMENGVSQQAPESEYAPQQPREGTFDESQETSQGGAQEQGGYDEQPSYGEEPSYSEESSEQPYYGSEEESSESDEWGGTGTVYENDNDELGGDAEGSSEDYGFDGVMGSEDRFSEMSDGNKVNPGALNTAKKIEWNKELLTRLMAKKAKLQNSNVSSGDVSKQIEIRKRRLAELENNLNKYENFEGEFSNAEGDFMNADGDYSEARGRKISPQARQARRAEVKKARVAARSERKQLREERKANRLGQGIRARRRKGFGGDATEVDKGLNPEFSEERIEIPSEETSEYTGLNGIDLANDYDAPDTRIVELKSNADGTSKKKINWVGIGIGVGVAALAIWAIRKYKVFNK